jgi:hypothetical protein
MTARENILVALGAGPTLGLLAAGLLAGGLSHDAMRLPVFAALISALLFPALANLLWLRRRSSPHVPAWGTNLPLGSTPE